MEFDSFRFLQSKALEWADKFGILKNSLETQSEKIMEEAAEVMEAVENKDTENLELELGDVLFSTITTCYVANLDPIRCLKNAIDKNNKRKDYK